APASHLAALLGTTAINYTLVGDPGTFLQGLALAADWLQDRHADGSLVVGAEEIDWLKADAYHLFARKIIRSEGAGAVYLSRAEQTTADAAEEGSWRSEASGPFPSWEGSGVGSAASVLIGDNSIHPAVRLHSITQPQLFILAQTR